MEQWWWWGDSKGKGKIIRLTECFIIIYKYLRRQIGDVYLEWLLGIVKGRNHYKKKYYFVIIFD